MNPPSNSGHPATPEFTPSTASKVLANAESRTVVQYLSAKETETTDLDELVDFVHEEIDTITTPEQIRIGLVHIHLPKLADYDVIEYDGRSELIHYRDHLQLEAMLDLTRQFEGEDENNG